MSPAAPTLSDHDPHAATHALVDQQLHMLTRLAQIGMSIADAAERVALAAADAAVAAAGEPAGEPRSGRPATPAGFGGDPGLVYSRVARAVRLTLMLQTRLLGERPALARAEDSTRSAHEHARRARAQRLVDRAIHDEHDDPEAAEALCDEARERLRDEDLSDDISGRNIAEVVARICRDLGVSPPADLLAKGAAPAAQAVDTAAPAALAALAAEAVGFPIPLRRSRADRPPGGDQGPARIGPRLRPVQARAPCAPPSG